VVVYAVACVLLRVASKDEIAFARRALLMAR